MMSFIWALFHRNAESQAEQESDPAAIEAREHLDPLALKQERILRKKLDNALVKAARRQMELRHTLAENTLKRVQGGI